jgi:cardiolipin synthase C
MSLTLRSVSALVLLLLAGCSTVQPERDRPLEQALAPVPMTALPGLARLDRHDHLVPLSLGPSALQWRLRALRVATRSIDLQTFIWKADSAGLALVREIIAAAERGVRVRILLDDSFLAHADPALRALSGHSNIEYRIYNPLANRSGNTLLRELDNLHDFNRINHRMHNKLLLVDGRIAILGGRNQADEYFGYQQQHNFRDFEFIVTGPFLLELDQVFDLYWNDPWSIPIEDLVEAGDAPDFEAAHTWVEAHAQAHLELATSTAEDWELLFQDGFAGDIKLLVDTPADTSPELDAPVQLGEALMQRIDEVQRDLVLVSAYFIPTEKLTAVIKKATQRGVRVRILTNSLGSNNHVSAHAAYAKHRPALLRAGAEIYELRPDAQTRELYLDAAVVQSLLGLHAKGIVFDDCCLFLGSANLDPRSLRLNTEVGVLVDSQELTARVRHMLEVDMRAENAWRVELDGRGELIWISREGEQSHAPPASFFLRAESWFFGLFPIEDEM